MTDKEITYDTKYDNQCEWNKLWARKLGPVFQHTSSTPLLYIHNVSFNCELTGLNVLH